MKILFLIKLIYANLFSIDIDNGIPVYSLEEGVWVLIRMWQYSNFMLSKLNK